MRKNSMDSGKKKALEESYERILNVGFCIIPYEDLSDIFVEDPVIFGTTKDERIFSFEGVKELFESQFEQMKGFEPTISRNRIASHISPDGNSAFIVEENTLTLNSADDVNDIFLRISCVMEYIDNDWKVTHWHGSTPVDTENDHWHQEEWKREKEKLQKLVDEQTADLQVKNRELEIDAAMERVWARTMAMQHSDELMETSELMFEQIKNLGIELWSCGFSLWYDDDSYFLGYNPGPDGKMGEPLKIPLTEDDFFITIREAKRRGDEFLVFESEGKSLEDTYRYMDTLPVVGETMRGFVEAGYPLPTYQVTHCGFFSNGHLMFITQERNPEAVEIFKQFTNVFNQTYTRFLDLQKAEAQAREAQIEAALERSRAQSMMMQHSDEIDTVSNVFHEQLILLGIHSEFSYVWLPDEDNQTHQFWASWSEEIAGESTLRSKQITYPLDKSEPYTAACFEAWSNPEVVLEEFIPPSDVASFFEVWHDLLDGAEKLKTEFFPDGIYYSEAYMRYGCFGINIRRNLSEDEKNILKRFSVEFERAYTRFLDLQKAEAQARENQIELALERVRARTMAMQSSEELAEAAFVLFEQLRELGGNLWGTGFGLCEKDSDNDAFWFANEHGVFPPVSIPNTTDPAHKKMHKGWKEGLEILSLEASGKELEEHYEYMMSLPEVRPFFQKILDDGLSLPDWQQWNAAYFSHGYLLIITMEPYPDPELLKRFARVFDQTYTRFLDLQKAEEQAREAQIELSLERIRAQVTAMQESSDLFDIVVKMRSEFVALGHKADSFWHMRWLPDVYEMSMTSEDGSRIGMVINVPKFVHDDIPKLAEWEIGDDPIFVLALDADDAWDYIENMNTHGHYEKADPHAPTREDIEHIGGLTFVIARTTHGEIGYSLPGVVPEPPEEAMEMLIRFARVFDLAYKRFEDLKIKENQHREAQIELALEKVRSRAMGMHSSDELNQLIGTLFTELTDLDLQLTRCIIGIFETDTKACRWWLANSEDPLKPNSFHIPYHEAPAYQAFLKAWKKRKPKYEYLLKGFEKEEWDEYLFTETGLSQLPDLVKKGMKEPESVILSQCYNNFGFLHVASLEPLPEDHFDVLLRFAKVFEQTYTRFLDLQKAEARAREAQIEAALERVRSRSMGMQKSDELIQVVREIGKGIQELGIHTDYSQIFTDFSLDPRNGLNIWVDVEGQNYLEKFHIPYIDHFITQKFYNQLNKGLDFFSNQFSKSDKDSFFKLLFKHSDLKKIPRERKKMILNAPGWTRCTVVQGESSLHFGRYSLENFTVEEREIFKRFGKVFGQAYTRFLDLQKAEAQAREARIEAALEKVRSRSLSMMSSDELGDVITVIFEELTQFDIPVEDGVALITFKENSKDLIEWMANSGFGSAMNFELPYFEHPVLSNLWQAKERGDQTFFHRYSKQESLTFHQHIFEHSDFKHTPEDVKKHCLNAETYATTIAFQNNTAIFINDYSGNTLTEADIDLLRRFSLVFEQTYTRFLDLQKAEEQTRQAQINLALERVRARSLAMQKPDDLNKVNEELLKQLEELHIDGLSGVSIWLFDEEGQVTAWDLSNPGNMRDPRSATIRYDATKFDLIGEPWRIFNTSDMDYVVLDYPVEKLRKAVKEWEEVDSSIADEFRQALDKGSLTHQWNPLARHSHGFLSIDLVKPPSDGIREIVTKMASVFSLAYLRFLDLQKAEAQAREAQIEAALERVRSRSMAMHKTDELQEVVRVVAEELKNTGVILDTGGAVICTYFQDSKDVIHWTATEDPAHPSVPYLLPYFKDELFDEAWASKNKRDDYFAKVFSHDVKNRFWEKAFKLSDYRQLPEDYKKIILESESHGLAWAWSKHSAIMIPSIQGDLPSEEEKEILIRFAKVFEQAYVRFLDLQKAEEQARESEIQLALERVRARSMAMQHSDELVETSELLFQQVKELGIELWSCGFSLWYDDDSYFIGYNPGPEGKMGPPLEIPLTEDIFFKTIRNAKRKGEEFLVFESEGESLAETYNYMDKLPVVGDVMRGFVEAGFDLPTYQVTHCGFFPQGHLMFITHKHYPEAHDIFKRFTKEFERTYTRFLDLQKAEQRAYESKVEASLERVRGMAAAMNHSDDLMQIAEEMFKELEILKINPLRYGLGLIDGEKKEAELWASTVNDGHYLDMLGTLSLTWHPMLQQTLDAWDGQHEEMIYELKGTELSDYYQKVGQINPDIPNLEQLQDPDTDIVQFASFFPFKTGALYAFTNGVPSNEGRSILKRFANVFEQAHIRYNDLQTAEKQARMIREERDRLEIALKELEATKDQLVQQEKLASLGQLTAGIAHEIKNPLNFVNNFSDLSVELVEETKDELLAVSDQLSAEDKEKVEEALEILRDIEMNLKKIHEHGSRADSIVKSMLEHSRGGSGNMEPTQINSLIKEFVNLSFHGMRAAKDPINVDLEFELDEEVGEIRLVAEDFSRVIINLANNAFDAMREKAKVKGETADGGAVKRDDLNDDYQPKLTVRTRRKDGEVIIEIEDNGPGIPNEMKDKIMQPFFTTKKGTAGTGLGLSITNDIIKAHGGTLQISSSPEGPTIFRIMLNK